jgi:hypothetical protein
MVYVFDSNAFSQLFKSYYRDRFPSLWCRFDSLVDEGRITSTREVLRELEDGPTESLHAWCKAHKHVFATPTPDEARFVSRIFGVQHFRQIIETKKLQRGGKNADPFVVARAAIVEGTVVTLEVEKPNGVKIPNVCRHFSVPCTSLEGFMAAENWTF